MLLLSYIISLTSVILYAFPRCLFAYYYFYDNQIQPALPTQPWEGLGRANFHDLCLLQ